MKRIFAITLVLLFLANASAHGQEGDLNAVKDYLQEHFPATGELRFNEAQEIIPLSNFVLGLHRPNLKFFKTRLRTHYFEFPELPVIIALDTDEPSDIRMLKSPIFTDAGDDFLSLFTGIPADGEERLGLINEIAEMFASLTHEGSIRNRASENPETYSIELWWGEEKYRVLIFQFGQEGLEHITVKPPQEPGEGVPEAQGRKSGTESIS